MNFIGHIFSTHVLHNRKLTINQPENLYSISRPLPHMGKGWPHARQTSVVEPCLIEVHTVATIVPYDRGQHQHQLDHY